MKIFPFILLGVLLCLQTACSTTSSVKRYSPKPITKEEISALELEADQESDDDVALDLLPIKAFPPNAKTRLQIEMDKYLGVRYRYGGSSSSGMDCSGFVSRVFADALNVKLPRSSSAQARAGTAVNKSDLQFGDLVFFKIRRNRISHVGVYLGDEQFMHASTKLGVVVSSLNEPYYKRAYATARRIGAF